MKDYRLKENRLEYFYALYRMNLEHGVMPGLVYLYMPKLAEYYGWGAEDKLWFAAINGCTQNPITSLKIFRKFPELPTTSARWMAMDEWFNLNWAELHFDTDRLKNKRNTVKALHSYGRLVKEVGLGSQAELWRPGQSWARLWAKATSIFSFGRLSAFSYLEYVKIMGFGGECEDLMFEDVEGSRSHRNGALFLQGLDQLVYDKRASNGFDGYYAEFKPMCKWLAEQADEQLKGFVDSRHGYHKNAGYFTLESQYCQFKNGFFRRRYPGVYADMAWERIEKYDAQGDSHLTDIFKAIRQDHLPNWLRIESLSKPPARDKLAAMFADTGFPYRGTHFLES